MDRIVMDYFYNQDDHPGNGLARGPKVFSNAFDKILDFINKNRNNELIFYLIDIEDQIIYLKGVINGTAIFRTIDSTPYGDINKILLLFLDIYLGVDRTIGRIEFTEHIQHTEGVNHEILSELKIIKRTIDSMISQFKMELKLSRDEFREPRRFYEGGYRKTRKARKSSRKD